MLGSHCHRCHHRHLTSLSPHHSVTTIVKKRLSSNNSNPATIDIMTQDRAVCIQGAPKDFIGPNYREERSEVETTKTCR